MPRKSRKLIGWLKVSGPFLGTKKGPDTLFFVVAVLLVIAGCHRDRTPGEKQARLIAAENMQLEKQLADQEAEIDKLKKQHAKDIKKLEDQLAACQRRNARLQQDIDKGIGERADSVRDTVMAENARLRAEIERLKSQPPDSP